MVMILIMVMVMVMVLSVIDIWVQLMLDQEAMSVQRCANVDGDTHILNLSQ